MRNDEIPLYSMLSLVFPIVGILMTLSMINLMLRIKPELLVGHLFEQSVIFMLYIIIPAFEIYGLKYGISTKRLGAGRLSISGIVVSVLSLIFTATVYIIFRHYPFRMI